MEKLSYRFAMAKKVSRGERSFEAMASVAVVDRSGDLVLPSAFANRLDRYRRNPVILFSHDYQAWPVGKTLDLSIETEGLLFAGQFAPTAEGVKAWENFEFGSLNAFSIGFIPHEWRSPSTEEQKTFGEVLTRVMTDVELLEISIVPVPANQDALRVMASWGIKMADMDDVKSFVEKVKAQKLIDAQSADDERAALEEATRLIEKLELDLFERELATMVAR